MQPYFASVKFTNQHGVKVGYFAEGSTQKEANDKLADGFFEVFQQLQTITEPVKWRKSPK